MILFFTILSEYEDEATAVLWNHDQRRINRRHKFGGQKGKNGRTYYSFS